jgi:hypothetical protein
MKCYRRVSKSRMELCSGRSRFRGGWSTRVSLRQFKGSKAFCLSTIYEACSDTVRTWLLPAPRLERLTCGIQAALCLLIMWWRESKRALVLNREKKHDSQELKWVLFDLTYRKGAWHFAGLVHLWPVYVGTQWRLASWRNIVHPISMNRFQLDGENCLRDGTGW